MEVKILHLYYDLMNLYGEYGNIEILSSHLKKCGFDVIIDRKTIGEQKNLSNYDVIYMGCGTELNQQEALIDMRECAEDLKNTIESEKILILTGNSFELLGKKIGEKDALDIFEFETLCIKRESQDIICTSEKYDGEIIGFVNMSGRVVNNNIPLFDVVWGIDEKTDGISYKNLIGTHLIGPLLVRNPQILKGIINTICEQKGVDYSEKDEDYLYENKAYEIVLKELKNRIIENK